MGSAGNTVKTTGGIESIAHSECHYILQQHLQQLEDPAKQATYFSVILFYFVGLWALHTQSLRWLSLTAADSS